VTQLDDSHLHWVAEIGGEQEEWDAEIVEQQPDRVIAWRSTTGLKNNGRVQFQPIDEGTRIDVTIEYDPDGMKESIGAFFGVDGGQVGDDLERFRELVENREVPTGAWRGEIRSGEVVEGDSSY
jgi:uncharacterized membrane protein